MEDARIQIRRFEEPQDEGPMKCLWMLAGVVDYKLCDRRYDCDQCPFDGAIRDGGREHKRNERTTGDGVSLIDVQGYELMAMLFYHPYHVWARIEDKGKVRIGLDDFGQKLMGRIYAVDLPAPGMRVKRNVACWRIAHHAGETAVAAPVSGIVLQVNPKLSAHPSLINRDPYGEGWSIIIQPVHLEQCLEQLYYGGKVERWYERDIQRLNRAMSDVLLSSRPSIGATMQDGGTRVQDFTSLLTADQMRQVIDSFVSGTVGSAAGSADVRGPDQGR
jgi:glycine cleavage system H lipoate-binding protein